VQIKKKGIGTVNLKSWFITPVVHMHTLATISEYIYKLYSSWVILKQNKQLPTLESNKNYSECNVQKQMQLLF